MVEVSTKNSVGKERKIKCCTVTTKYLHYCLIFPEEGKEHSAEYTVKILALFFVVFLICGGTLSHCIFAIKNNYDFAIFNFDIVIIISVSGVMWINGFFYKNREIFLELTRSISDFDLFEKPPGYEKFNEKLNVLAKYHLIYAISGGLAYFAIFAPLHTQNCKELNFKKNITEICLLFSPLYIPNMQSFISAFPVVQILTFFQFIIFMIIYTTCGSILWINVECVEHIRFRISHLKMKFLMALNEKNRIKRRSMFNNAIRYHNEVLRMGDLVDKFFGTELFLHVVLTAAILGCCAFIMIDSKSLDTLMLFVGWLNAIIMGCVSGQRLINESLTIPELINTVEWQNFENQLKKDIVMFLLRCKKPMSIRAGNVIMTNQLIIEILQTAYSYLTLLSSVNNEK